jgi:hypothetical protein
MLARIKAATDFNGAIIGEPTLPLEVLEFAGRRYYVQKPCSGEGCRAYQKEGQKFLFTSTDGRVG